MTDISIAEGQKRKPRDIAFAAGVLAILAVFFLPVPPWMVDVGLVISISLSVLILMVALWIERPLEFSAFPTILLVATLLRLALNIATTRLILSGGSHGEHAAGHIIAGFSNLVMSGDFLIGLIVFVILVTVNFLVITKGATRIAEVGARFTLDAIPGKQMAIDADLSSGLIDEQEARRRRHELEEDSAFFGAMDGASKFVRGDAIAGLVILGVNVVGGVLIGMLRHGMSPGAALDVYTKLSVGDGLVSQIPALIVSLGAGLIVAKGGVRGSAESTVLAQLSNHPRAAIVSAALLFSLGLTPGLPFFPFALLAGVLVGVGRASAARNLRREAALAIPPALDKPQEEVARDSVREELSSPEIELRFGKQIAAEFLMAQGELAHRLARMRRKFARRYGIVVPPVRIADDIGMDARSYEIRIHGACVARFRLHPGEVMVVTGDGRRPDYPCEDARDPAFGVKAVWVSQAFTAGLKRDGFAPVDHMSLALTHLSEVIRGNLAQLLAYKDLRALIDRLDPDYRRLVDEITPQHLSMSGVQAVLKLLLAERVSIRNLHLVLEAIAEIAPHARRPEQIAEHVRIRMAQQICGDLLDDGMLKVMRLGPRWDLAFHQALKRDARGDVVEIDLEPRMVEEFSQEAAPAIRKRMDDGHAFVVLTAAEVRPFVRMILERMFPNLQTLSHLEVARGVEIQALGAIS
jgi:flagellar biosynthesis protein FlhA